MNGQESPPFTLGKSSSKTSLSGLILCFLLSQYEYKLDREFLKGCKLSVTDDKYMVLALRNSLIESDVSILPSTVSALA